MGPRTKGPAHEVQKFTIMNLLLRAGGAVAYGMQQLSKPPGKCGSQWEDT